MRKFKDNNKAKCFREGGQCITKEFFADLYCICQRHAHYCGMKLEQRKVYFMLIPNSSKKFLPAVDGGVLAGFMST